MRNARTIAFGVESHPDRMCGEPCVAGTRITTRAVAHFFAAGCSHKGITEQYRGLSARQINHAVRFEMHRLLARVERTDAAIEALRDALRELDV